MLKNIIKNIRQWSYQNNVQARAKENTFLVHNVNEWGVRVGRENEYFRSEAVAQTFAYKNNIPHTDIAVYPTTRIEPTTMHWLIKQREKGVNIGLLSRRIQQAHADNFDDIHAWFKNEPRPSSEAAYQFLAFAFSLDRNDAVKTIAQWANANPAKWFDANKLIENNDHDIHSYVQEENVSLHEDASCLAGRLIQKPVLMQWFLNQELGLKHNLQEPHHWKLLSNTVNIAQPPHAYVWPATAKRVFNINVSPTQIQWPLYSTQAARDLVSSFVHDPAAQLYIMHAHIHRKDKRECAPFQNDHYLIPEIMEMYHRMREKIDSSYKRETTDIHVYNRTTVEALMLGIHLDLDSISFYQHAQTIFNSNNTPVETLIEFDATIFTM